MNGQHDFRLGEVKIEGSPLADVERAMVCQNCLCRMNEASQVCPGKPVQQQTREKAIVRPKETR